MAHDFVQVMAKVSTLGQDTSTLVDCSDVIPTPKSLARSRRAASFPKGKGSGDIEASVGGHACVCLALISLQCFAVPHRPIFFFVMPKTVNLNLSTHAYAHKPALAKLIPYALVTPCIMYSRLSRMFSFCPHCQMVVYICSYPDCRICGDACGQVDHAA